MHNQCWRSPEEKCLWELNSLWRNVLRLLMVCEVSANQREVFVFRWVRVCIVARSVYSSTATTSRCWRRAAGAEAAMTTGQFLQPPAASCSRSRQRASEKNLTFLRAVVGGLNLFFWFSAGSKKCFLGQWDFISVSLLFERWEVMIGPCWSSCWVWITASPIKKKKKNF